MGDRPNRSGETTRIRSYRDLAVWQEAMELVTEVYAMTQAFPSEERFGLSSQLRRSAVSVPSNVAEGWGRGQTNEYLQHLRYAQGSLREAETQVLIAERVGYVDASSAAPILERADRLSRMLRGLIRSLRQHTPQA